MKIIILRILFGVIFIASCSDKMSFAPPTAPKHIHQTKIHGQEFIDNYAWLKHTTKNHPSEIIDYLNAENHYTSKMMEKTLSLRERIFSEMKSRLKESDESYPYQYKDYFYYHSILDGEQHRSYYRKDKNNNIELILDYNKLAKGSQGFSVKRREISPSQNLVAYTVDYTGSETYDLYIKNIKTGKTIETKLKNIFGSFVWGNDDQTIYYLKEDHSKRPYQIFKYDLNTGNEKLIYEDKDEKYYVYIEKSIFEDKYFIGSESYLQTEYHIMDLNDNISLINHRRKDHRYFPFESNEQLYILSNKDGENFAIYTCSKKCADEKDWTVLRAHNPDQYIVNISVFKTHLAIIFRENGQQYLSIRNKKTGNEKIVEFPDEIYSISMAENHIFTASKFRFYYESPITPYSVIDIDFETLEKTVLKTKDVPHYDKSLYQVKRLWAPSHDGKLIPITMVALKSLQQNSMNFLSLYGYSSYGANIDPGFRISLFSLVDREVVSATCHARGSSTLGMNWYMQGKLLNKINTFKDFISCAEFLIQEKYSSKKKISIHGGSAGGLLIGAVLNMRPDLFSSAVAQVPFVDSLNTMLDDKLPLTTNEYEEWGNPNDKEYFNYMKSYAPYENIKSQNYPHILAVSGLHDTRVGYWEAAKWVAKLREFNTSPNYILLKTEMEKGHAGAAGRYDYLKELAYIYAFILTYK
ncbi:MAG: S9 family peptidase [Halobacteriovoraceae bacterium]|nr:S9 family peptidase [Halobacteriovoraceae bacterium]